MRKLSSTINANSDAHTRTHNRIRKSSNQNVITRGCRIGAMVPM